MKVAVCYCHLLALGHDPHRVRTVEEYTDAARRFAATYKQFQAEADHELVVMFQRGHATRRDFEIWDGIKCWFVDHNPPPERDWEWAAQTTLADYPCDFMVGFCTRTHFHRPGWLKRVVDARVKHGDGFYGSMAGFAGSPLQTHPAPNPHLRGSMWAYDQQTIKQFPHKITTMEDEYRLECGEWNIANWYESIGKPAMLVTFDGEYSKPDWDKPENTFCKGDQSNLLHWDRHTDAFRLNLPLEGPGRA